jgi:hypothetical protein
LTPPHRRRRSRASGSPISPHRGYFLHARFPSSPRLSFSSCASPRSAQHPLGWARTSAPARPTRATLIAAATVSFCCKCLLCSS